jgi:hypothetical protein
LVYLLYAWLHFKEVIYMHLRSYLYMYVFFYYQAREKFVSLKKNTRAEIVAELEEVCFAFILTLVTHLSIS